MAEQKLLSSVVTGLYHVTTASQSALCIGDSQVSVDIQGDLSAPIQYKDVILPV